MARKIYSKEFREQIVKLAQDGRSLAELAQEYELTVQTIRKWLAEAASSSTKTAALVKENRRLRQEIARLREEQAILEKAADWFAKETTKPPSRSKSFKT